MANTVRIEEAVRAMLNASVAVANLVDTRISHGYRLQNTTLPAITYEVASAVQQSLSGPTDIWLASVEINVIASSTKEALDVLPALRIACVKGTYGNAVFEAVMWNGHTTSAAVVGEGDEQEPAEVTASIDIYYRD